MSGFNTAALKNKCSQLTGKAYDPLLIPKGVSPMSGMKGGLGGRVSVSKVGEFAKQHTQADVVGIDCGNSTLFITFDVAIGKSNWAYVHTFMERFTSVIKSTIETFGISIDDYTMFNVELNGSNIQGNVRTEVQENGMSVIAYANVRFGQIFEGRNSGEGYEALRSLFVKQLGVSEGEWVVIQKHLAQNLQDYDNS